MLTYVLLIQNDPNNMNSIVYHLIIVRYLMETVLWYFPWATALHLYNLTGRGEKLQQLHCYHPFSDSLDIWLTKNHYENYSPKMVPIAKIWGSGSWTKTCKEMSCLSSEYFGGKAWRYVLHEGPVSKSVLRSYQILCVWNSRTGD